MNKRESKELDGGNIINLWEGDGRRFSDLQIF